MKYTYATVCSGVEGCSLALDAAPPTKGEWEPIFFSEIAKFPAAVLAHRFPSVPNLGDMTQIKVTDEGITNGSATISFHGRLDLLAGGTPCQDFSVAGRRAGGGKEAAPEAPSVGSGSVSCPSWLLASCSGKMSQGVFPRTAEPTSPDSWPRFATSGMAVHGEFWTANTPEWTSGPWPSRSDGGVCGLSAWLMPTWAVPQKYYLSRRACLGVLSRSERRGRPLPPALEVALREQAQAYAPEEGGEHS